RVCCLWGRASLGTISGQVRFAARRSAHLASQGTDAVHRIGKLDQRAQVGQVRGALTTLLEQCWYPLFGLACLAVAREVRLRVVDGAQVAVELDPLARDDEFGRTRRELGLMGRHQL